MTTSISTNINSFPLSADWRGRAAGNGRLITHLMGNIRQNHKFGSPLLVLMEYMRAEIKGDEKQLIDLEWPYGSP